MPQAARSRTAAPVSKQTGKRNLFSQSGHVTPLLSGFQPLPKLRHTSIKNAKGRRKQHVTMIPLSTDAASDLDADPLAEKTELETFQHFLADGEWLPIEDNRESSVATRDGKSRKKRRK